MREDWFLKKFILFNGKFYASSRMKQSKFLPLNLGERAFIKQITT
jgi:hypothetical protein